MTLIIPSLLALRLRISATSRRHRVWIKARWNCFLGRPFGVFVRCSESSRIAELPGTEVPSRWKFQSWTMERIALKQAVSVVTFRTTPLLRTLEGAILEFLQSLKAPFWYRPILCHFCLPNFVACSTWPDQHDRRAKP